MFVHALPPRRESRCASVRAARVLAVLVTALSWLPSLATADPVLIKKGDLLSGPECMGIRRGGPGMVTKSLWTPPEGPRKWVIEYWSVTPRASRRLMWFRPEVDAQPFFEQRLEKLNMHLGKLDLETCTRFASSGGGAFSGTVAGEPVRVQSRGGEVLVSVAGGAFKVARRGGTAALGKGWPGLEKTPPKREKLVEVVPHPKLRLLFFLLERDGERGLERLVDVAFLDQLSDVGVASAAPVPQPAPVPEPVPVPEPAPAPEPAPEPVPAPEVVLSELPAFVQPLFSPEPAVVVPPPVVVAPSAPEVAPPRPESAPRRPEPAPLRPEPAQKVAVVTPPAPVAPVPGPTVVGSAPSVTGTLTAAALVRRAPPLTVAWLERPYRCLGLAADSGDIVLGTVTTDEVSVRIHGTTTRTLFTRRGSDAFMLFGDAVTSLSAKIFGMAPAECLDATRRHSALYFAIFRGEPVMVTLKLVGDTTRVVVQLPGKKPTDLGPLGLRDAADVEAIYTNGVAPVLVLVGREDGEDVVRRFSFHTLVAPR